MSYNAFTDLAIVPVVDVLMFELLLWVRGPLTVGGWWVLWVFMTKRLLGICLIFGTLLRLGECAEPDYAVVYKTVGETALKLHVFKPEGEVAEARPAIVFFFGGGWRGGSVNQFYPHCRYLASRGMVAIAAEYRVENRNQTSPRECVMDGKSAIRWVREHAAELEVDPDRIAAGGGSAGGHVAAACATTVGFEEAGENPGISCRPNALVLFNPVFDNGPNGYGYERVRDYWQDFSPLHTLSKGAPPTVVFLGTEDKYIPVETARVYKRRMEEVGSRCDLFLYEGKRHGFFNYKNLESYVTTVTEMDRFLASLGYLEGEPTVGG